jgi:uncharacterized protein YkwD
MVAMSTAIAPVERALAADLVFNQRMLELINRERVANGLQPVVANGILAAAAEDAPYLGCPVPVSGRARDMGTRNYFSHTILNCDNKGVFALLNATSLLYSGAAENIAWMNGTTDPVVAAENLHSQLMSSPGHRANILNPSFTSVGIGSWHTEPNQTWSGAGYPLGRVFIVSQIFAGLPLGLDTVTAPTTTPTTAPMTSVPAPEAASRFTPFSPARILDTRSGIGASGPPGPGGVVDVQVAGQGGVPATGVAAVAFNVTVTQPSSEGFLTLYPSGSTRPLASNLNFSPGETVSNLVILKVGGNGRISIYNLAGTSHVVGDVAGWYAEGAAGSGGRLEPLAPNRILDTRAGAAGATRLGPGASLDLQVAGRGGVPVTGAQAAVLNLVVTGTTDPGYLTVYPTAEPRPLASNVTFPAGATLANRAIAKLGSGGKVTIYNSGGGTDVVVDLSGWYTDATVPGSLGGLVPVVPNRIVDTRDTTIGGPVGALAAGTVASVQVGGRGGVPASGARAVVMNVTVTGPTNAGYLTIFPAGVAPPLTSDVTFVAGDTQPNLVVVPLGEGGRLGLFASASTHVVMDVTGWAT